MTSSLIDMMSRQEKRLARSRAAAGDASGFGIRTRRDLLPGALRAALELRWDGSALLARRRDAVDQHWYQLGDRDGTVAEGAPELLRGWTGALRLTDDELVVADDEWPAIAAEVTRLEVADRAAADAVLGTLQTLPRALAGRYVRFMALWIDSDNELVGHPSDGPIEIVVSDGTDDLDRPRARTPRWMPRLTAPKPPAPEARVITAELLREIAVDRTLLQYGEKIDNWADVLDELRRLVVNNKR